MRVRSRTRSVRVRTRTPSHPGTSRRSRGRGADVGPDVEHDAHVMDEVDCRVGRAVEDERVDDGRDRVDRRLEPMLHTPDGRLDDARRWAVGCRRGRPQLALRGSRHGRALSTSRGDARSARAVRRQGTTGSTASVDRRSAGSRTSASCARRLRPWAADGRDRARRSCRASGTARSCCRRGASRCHPSSST